MDNFSDNLQLQHLAGGNITGKPPLFDASGEFLFVMCHDIIQVYSINTGELARQLIGATEKLVSMQIELKKAEILVACTVTGEILRWIWSTGSLDDRIKLDIPPGDILTFDLLNLYGNSDAPCGFVLIRAPDGKFIWFVVNTRTGGYLKVPCNLNLDFKKSNPLVAVGVNQFKYIVIALNHNVYFISYENWRWVCLKNAHRVPITVVRFNPKEEMIATGDKDGKVFLWRDFMKGQRGLKTTLYHWHHTSVTSLAFSASGLSFFSGGLESVLVKWDVKTHETMFVPRMSGVICNIAVSINNTVAVSTADNSLHIVGNNNKLQNNLQKFTYVADDETGKSKFPIGLRMNPRTNTLVLNGRLGQLQFYSAYTKSLLYNLDIVNQNRLSWEKGKILYNIRVEKAAFNIDWMATGEVFDDEQHCPELRLKFWKYRPDLQNYMLNTNIEMPHELGFKAIEFSNDYQVNNLYCATLGLDNTIKIWAEEDSENFNIKHKIWSCIAETRYKNSTIDCICFSQDGSLLAAGAGNTLCIYESENLKLKAALTGTGGVDGCLRKAQVRLPKHKINGSKNEMVERRRKLLKLFTNLLENNEETLLKEIKKTMMSTEKKKESKTKTNTMKADNLDAQLKQQLYNKILQMHELNLYQKLMLFQKLQINCKVEPKLRQEMTEYLCQTVDYIKMRQKIRKLEGQVQRLNLRERFKAKHRLQQYTRRKKNYDKEITNNLVPIMSVLNLQEQIKPTTQTITKMTQSRRSQFNSHNSSNSNDRDFAQKAIKTADATQKLLPPAQTTAQITHLQFAAGEYAHLVVACTETRVLVWNLLTLRLQSVLKLSAQHLAFDENTNLLAILTKNNELHVFQAQVPLPIYQRKNLPHIEGVCWLPRRQPKQRSINIDWQAHSTLYFLSKNQEILFLNAPNEIAPEGPPPITFNEAASATAFQYTTFGAYAVQQHTDKGTRVPAAHLGSVVTSNTRKSAVKSLIEMSTHTMAPLSLLADDFLQSLVYPNDSSSLNTTNKQNAAETQQKRQPIKSKKQKSSQLVNGFWHVAPNAVTVNGLLHTDDEQDDDDDDDDDVENEDKVNDMDVDDVDITTDIDFEQKSLMRNKKILGLNEQNQNRLHFENSTTKNIAATKQEEPETQLRKIAALEIELNF